MHLFDPSRPRAAHGQPLLTSGGMVPTWYLVPQSPEAIKIIVFLHASRNSYRDYSISVPPAILSDLWQKWLADPEAFARQYFGYQGPQESPEATISPASPPARLKETAEELGL